MNAPRSLALAPAIAIAALSVMGLYLSTGRANGAELVVEPSVSSRLEYSDNPALRIVGDGSWLFNVVPAIALVRRTESAEASLRARLGFNRYTNPTVPDATDKFLSFAGSQSFERSRGTLLLGYSEQSSQVVSLLQQTGLNLGLRRVDAWNVAPGWTYSLSPRWNANIDATWEQSRFSQDAVRGVTDFQSAGASVGVNYLPGPRTTAGLTVGYSAFDTDLFTTQSRTVSTNFSVTHSMSETLKVSVRVGWQEVVTRQNRTVLLCPAPQVLCQLGLVPLVPTGAVGESRSDLVPFNVGVQWKLSERDRIDASLQQRVNPAGIGALTRAFLASLAYERALSPTVDLSISAGFTHTRTLERSSLGEVLSLSPRLTWRLSEAWTAGAGYAYTALRYPNLDQSVQSNAVFATLSYRWPVWQVRQ